MKEYVPQESSSSQAKYSNTSLAMYTSGNHSEKAAMAAKVSLKKVLNIYKNGIHDMNLGKGEPAEPLRSHGDILTLLGSTLTTFLGSTGRGREIATSGEASGENSLEGAWETGREASLATLGETRREASRETALTVATVTVTVVRTSRGETTLATARRAGRETGRETRLNAGRNVRRQTGGISSLSLEVAGIT
ncbi:hypothetical protein NPX13_g6923 [Xylaria arbuscula]|uniref:Uncharacterized protein n=1 Tax=Xylaria arbuscula TaxID=114810 RepID=A0A9W8NBA5_9PEZI|nr:hypothetical protein NPX13_g6923 [Xylaria arbuscula]